MQPPIPGPIPPATTTVPPPISTAPSTPPTPVTPTTVFQLTPPDPDAWTIVVQVFQIAGPVLLAISAYLTWRSARASESSANVARVNSDRAALAQARRALPGLRVIVRRDDPYRETSPMTIEVHNDHDTNVARDLRVRLGTDVASLRDLAGTKSVSAMNPEWWAVGDFTCVQPVHDQTFEDPTKKKDVLTGELHFWDNDEIYPWKQVFAVREDLAVNSNSRAYANYKTHSLTTPPERTDEQPRLANGGRPSRPRWIGQKRPR